MDRKLVKEAQTLGKFSNEGAAVEEALRELVNKLKRKSMLDLFGKVRWEGDLNQMR
ncbi:MAG: type II toxin-antitoxin system VapB family antitoxin [Taibaiella sp.]|nr:type II toxin-antitoxin system VapB family antitoxin [Taibaiella sp.]